MTRGEAVRAAAARLAAAGVDTPDLDARELAMEAFGLDLSGLIARSAEAVTAGEHATLDSFLSRRIAGEPVDRILGRREFWGLDFVLAPETLSPRPDTETIVEAALAGLGDRQRPWRIVDLGVGSGCILLALLSELPNATGVGCDLSWSAAVAARRNAVRLGLADRAAFVVGDWAAALGGRFDLVVSNPPYIPSDHIARLDIDVRDHDPALALDGGADGLVAYRTIVADLARLLAPGGLAVLEVGFGQEDDVAELGRAAGHVVDGAARRDLGGVARALVLRSRGAAGCER